MKAFEFPLQTALKVRELKQDEAHLRFAAIQRDYNRAEDQLRHYHDLMLRADETARAATERDIDVMVMLNHDVYRRRMTQLISQQTEICSSLRTELSHARTALMEACRDRQTLEKLRETRYEEYLGQVTIEESHAIDEAGTMGYIFKQDTPLGVDFQTMGPPLEAC
jgi:flagellar export protein FliJ